MIRIFNPMDKRRHDWRLQKGTYVIGRSPECDLVIKDDTISRRHAQIEIVDEQTINLIDLGSHNGTTVNGNRITGPIALKHKDVIVFGRVEVKLTIDEISRIRDSSISITDIDDDLTKVTLFPMKEALQPLPSTCHLLISSTSKCFPAGVALQCNMISSILLIMKMILI